MSDKPFLKEEIIFGNYALIKSTKEDADFNRPVFAINWFNTNPKWMYNLYNLLAARSVFKIGGKVFFKGEVIKTFQGRDEDARNMLLIINYPSAFNFLELAKDRYFQLVSIFRIIAVRKFSFGFTERLSGEKALENTVSNFDKSKAYAVMHFKSGQLLSNFLPPLKFIAESSDSRIHYAGQVSSLLYSGNKNGEEMQVPCLLDGIILLEGDSNARLEAMMTEPIFQKLITQFDSSYIALVKRTL
jgi:uncharacterized protein (DUF1330 family)